jgi:hypothetical protein
MTKQTTPTLYKKYHVGRAYEISSLFEKLTERYKIQSVLYPGCYVHITPSFFIPRGVYVDTEMKAEEFFDDPNFLKYIESRKTYDGKPEITFYHQSYEKPIDEPEGSSDLLVSKYAGFVSKGTKKYLKTGGILVANNSHGDAGLASLDLDFKFIAVANNRGSKVVLSEKELGRYFIPKKKTNITAQNLKELGRGVGYTKTATNYIFEKK